MSREDLERDRDLPVGAHASLTPVESPDVTSESEDVFLSGEL